MKNEDFNFLSLYNRPDQKGLALLEYVKHEEESTSMFSIFSVLWNKEIFILTMLGINFIFYK